VAIVSDYSTKANNLESTHALLIAQSDYDRISANPVTTLPGQKVLLTPASTAQMYAEYCFAGWNITLDRMTIIKRNQQEEIRKALEDKTANIAIAWSPFTYLAETGPAKAKILPCSNMPNIQVPTFIVARSDLLTEPDAGRLASNRQEIGAFVANYLGAWSAAKNKPQDAAKRLVKTYADEGIHVSESQARTELSARQLPNLADQRIALAAPTGGVTPLTSNLDVIMNFMIRSGTLKSEERPAASDLIDPSILNFIDADAPLKARAEGKTD